MKLLGQIERVVNPLHPEPLPQAGAAEAIEVLKHAKQIPTPLRESAVRYAKQMLEAPQEPELNLRILDRMPAEDEHAWGAWIMWRDWGHTVNGGPAARRWEDLVEHYSVVFQISAVEADTWLGKCRDAYAWGLRARVWDAAMQRAVLAGSAEAIRERRKAHLDLALRMQGLAQAEIVKLQRKALESVDLAAITPSDAVKLATEGVKIERLISGESTENYALKGVVDLSKLSDEELDTYRALLDKASQG